jgi:hypothetical protein
MRGDALYRIIGGMVLVAFAIAVPVVKFHDAADLGAALSGNVMLIVGCLAIGLLGVLVSVSGARYLKRIGMMTDLIVRMVEEQSRVVTTEIAEGVGLHEVDVRERIEEMIHNRTIPTGTRITYVGGEKIVGQPKG